MSTLALIFAAVLATNGVSSAGQTNGVTVVDVTNRVVTAGPPAHITSDTTYYDRKEGVAIFKGHVHVDDKDYQMHARRAYVFMSASNTLSQIAATGAVALTNGTKRAYGEKATYHRENGLIVLHGVPGKPAHVVEETPNGDRSVQGRKIRFWINREQVEVVEADLSAPTSGKQAIPFAIRGGK